MSLVALSAPYGAGGSRIGPALAARLQVPFLDRAIPAAVADELSVPLSDAEAHDDRLSAGWLQRLLSGFVAHDSGAPTPVPTAANSAEDFKLATEEVLLRQAASGEGVILGRAATILLRDDPRVLRARLDGPTERRVLKAMSLERIDEATAQRRMRQLDHAHETYIKHFYGIDVHDPSLYHVTIDSTCLTFEACVKMLLAAVAGLDTMSFLPDSSVNPTASGPARS